jgi:hypothetical protein
MRELYIWTGAALLMTVAAPSDAAVAATVASVEADCSQAVAHGVDHRSPSPAPAVGCMYATGFRAVSPSIQVTSGGALFIARSEGGVLRSTDHGQHWKYLRVPPIPDGDSHRIAIHGYVHVDPRTDRVYYVTSLGAASCGGFAGAVVSWSDDLGESWTGTTVACDTYDWGKVLTGPAPSGNAYPSAIYFFGVAPRLVGGERLVYRSLDGGTTWQRMPNIAEATTEAGVGAAAPDGTVYFDYPEFYGFYPVGKFNKTYPYDPANKCHQMIAVSEDFGQTWRQEPVPFSRACKLLYGQQRVAVDQNGTVYVVWVDDSDGQLYLSYSSDRAHTWSPPVNVMAPGMTFSLTHANIIAAQPGHILIAALETSAAENPLKGIVQGLGDYYAILTESFNATASAPQFRSVNLDPPDDPTLAKGEISDEANAYLGISPSGEGWAVFARHSVLSGPGEIAAAHIQGR